MGDSLYNLAHPARLSQSPKGDVGHRHPGGCLHTTIVTLSTTRGAQVTFQLDVFGVRKIPQVRPEFLAYERQEGEQEGFEASTGVLCSQGKEGRYQAQQ